MTEKDWRETKQRKSVRHLHSVIYREDGSISIEKRKRYIYRHEAERERGLECRRLERGREVDR